MNIPANLSKGWASWTWQKMHAQCFNEDSAQDVIQRFGTCGLYPVPDNEFIKLRNEVGCFIHYLIDDDAPYLP